MITLIFLVAMLVIFWMLVIAPQRRRKQLQRMLLEELKAGDEVMTVGGLFGTVREVGDHHVELEIAPNTRVRLAKSAVTARSETHLDQAETTEAPLP